MNDSDTKGEQENDGVTQEERLSAMKTATGGIRESLIKIGIPPVWGTLIAAILGAGMTLLISLSSTGCHGLTHWSMEGEQGELQIKRDPASGTILIEGKRNVSVDGGK